MKSTVICRACGASLDATAQFCVSCGVPVTAQLPSIPMPGAPRGLKVRMLEQLRDATLGEYEILLELGSGGMATVYLAHDLQLDRKVAIKLMHPTLVVGDDMVERFILEARTAAGLSHANIVPIYAVKVQEDLLYFVMKFVEGRPLDSIIKAESPLAADTVRHIVIQVADALGYAHRRGVIHRDIKPANIIISTDGHPILADFGIAKVADKPGLTLTGATIGTPTYMSPEQCGAEAVTGASDQYSLGVTAFEMLTGSPPFDAVSHMTIMLKQISEPAPSMLEKAPDCPRDLAAAIDRMLAKEPGDRFATMEEVVDTLHAATVTSAHTVRTQLVSFALADPRREQLKRVSTPRSPIPTAARRARTEENGAAPLVPASRAGWIAGGVLAVAAAGALLFTQRNRTPERAVDTVILAPSPPAVAIPQAGAESVVSQPPPSAALPKPNPPVPQASPPVRGAVPPAKPPERTAPLAAAAVRIVGPASLTPGTAGALQVEVRDSEGTILSGRPVAWMSSAPAVVSVSTDGRLEARSEGHAVITATVDGVSQQLPVAVGGEPVAAVVLDPATLTLAAGESAPLAAKVSGASGKPLDREVQWSSSTTSVATVTAFGRVNAVAPGNTTITASSGDRSATANVTVTAPDAPPSDAERRQQIVAMFEDYAKALETRNLARVRQYYPTMPATREQQLRQALSTMENLQVRLNVGKIDSGAGGAVAHVTGTWLFTSQGQRQTLPADERYQLEHRGNQWVITDIR